MSSQYHFEHESSLCESPVNQAVRFFTRDWETTNDQINSFSDPLEGKIIAQMPDLGECRTISEVRRSQQQSGNWLNRLYSGLTLISYFPKWIRQVLPDIKLRKFQFSFIKQQKFYRNLIVLCLVVFVIGGGFLIYKSNKQQWKEAAHRDSDQNIAQNVKPSEATPTPAENPTPSPVTPPKEKPRTPPAEKPAITAPVTTVAVITPDASETKKKDQNNVHSPWERSVTDNYSPWPVDTQSRLEAAAATVELEPAGVSTTSMNPVPPTTNPSVPLVPMTPLVPNQSGIPANAAVNTNTNNIVNPVNNTVSIANNAVPVVNNVSPAVANNTVLPIPVTQPGLPHSPNANGVVTVYSQHNIPVPYDYRATYERANIPPAPALVPPTQPVYPPQTYNGQPGQIQSGQYQQQIVTPSYQGTPTVNNVTIPVPMYGVAPQPQPVPMTGTAPIPIQPVAPIQRTASLPIPQEIISSPTIPAGMVPPAGTMSMAQPIPTQVASIPPTYYSPPAYSHPVPPANVPGSPSYYPPAVTIPYYQQGNTNTSAPYRRLY
jgi:hypothetical protein